MLKELEQVFTGAVIRSIAGIVDVGEAILSHFADPDGGPVWEIADDKSDIWVHTQCSTDETPTGRKTSRLFTPGNMLFNLPADGESALVVRGRDSDGPGQPYALYGDCGAANQVPSWLDDSNAGISVAKKVHVESTNDEVDLTGTVVNINGTDYSLLKTETLLGDLSTLMDYFITWVPLVVTAVATAPSGTAADPGIVAQASAIKSAIAAGTYKSTKAKNG